MGCYGQSFCHCGPPVLNVSWSLLLPSCSAWNRSTPKPDLQPGFMRYEWQVLGTVILKLPRTSLSGWGGPHQVGPLRTWGATTGREAGSLGRGCFGVFLFGWLVGRLIGLGFCFCRIFCCCLLFVCLLFCLKQCFF